MNQFYSTQVLLLYSSNILGHYFLLLLEYNDFKVTPLLLKYIFWLPDPPLRVKSTVKNNELIAWK